MKKALRASRLIGLLVLVLSLMGISATAAQAEVGAHWNINKAEYKTGLTVEVGTKLVGSFGTLLTKVGLTKVEILCTTLSFKDALLKVLGGASGKIHFEGCITKLNGGAAAGACKPHSPGATEGLIETNLLDGLIKLHTPEVGGKVDLLELLPTKVGETTPPFVTIVMGKEVGSECSIGAKFDITGPAFLKDSKGEGLVELKEHEVEEGPLTKLLFGANAATIDGKALASLSDTEHKGMTFSGIAN